MADVLVCHNSGNTMQVDVEAAERIIRRHLEPPWFDAPDEAGYWWHRDIQSGAFKFPYDRLVEVHHYEGSTDKPESVVLMCYRDGGLKNVKAIGGLWQKVIEAMRREPD